MSYSPKLWYRLVVICLMGFAALGCACEDSTDEAPTLLHSNTLTVGSRTPNLVKTDQHVVLSWVEPAGPGFALKWAQLIGMKWSEPITVAQGEDWFVNWADFPSVVPISDRTWAAHWLTKKPGGAFAYDVTMTVSSDGGVSWGPPFSPHRDNTPTEHGFVSLFPLQGSVAAVWLDGRNIQPADHAHAHGAGGMTLRSAAVTRSGSLGQKHVIDSLVCDCCQTDVALSARGPVVVYRNRTVDEIRDIYVARYSDDAWTEPVAVADDGWHIDGCPVNGPAIDASGSRVVAAWFTAANDTPLVRFAQSHDSARTFGAALDVSSDQPIGRVDVVQLEDGSALVSWLRSHSEASSEIVLRRVARAGVLGPEFVIGRTVSGRMSGFPKMVVSGDFVVLAWTDRTAHGQCAI